MKRTVILVAFLLAGAVLFQSFQCSSRNITTARVKMKNNLPDEAIESLNKELEVNPNSDEALALLADIYKTKNNFKESAKYAMKVLEVSKNPDLIKEEKKLIYVLWTGTYNAGISSYSSYLSSKNPAALDSALESFKLGSQLYPEYLEFYNFIGLVHEAKNDNQAAKESYLEYVKRFDKNYQFAIKNGLYYKIPRYKVIDKLGNPKESVPGVNPSNNDSVYTDFYIIDGKELYVFSESTDNKMLVNGWNFDPPANRLIEERRMRSDINTAPMSILAQQYYNDKDLENSLKYIKMITALEPDNANAYSSMVSIYQDLNRTDEAIKTIENLIKSEPNNAVYITQLADLYHNLQKYDDAIISYQKALESDSKYDRALRNLASAYKNRAYLKQKAEQDKHDANQSYKINMEAYLPDLRESAKYFAKSLQTTTYSNDHLILSELANIYQVLEQKEDLKKTVRNLEAVESLVPDNQKQQYYLNMLKIYSDMGENKKADEIQKKIK